MVAPSGISSGGHVFSSDAGSAPPRYHYGMPAPSIATLLWRALGRHCPECGRGSVMASHFRVNRECPNCHVVFWKDPGETLGAMYLDYVIAFGCFFVAWGLFALLSDLPEVTEIVVLSAITVGSLLIFYPLSRSFWTMLVYMSGGIERPSLRAVSGGRKS